MTSSAAAAIARAIDAAHSAYWNACDDAGRAIAPADLGVFGDLLDDAYDAALKVQDVAQAQGIPWLEARDFV